MPTRPSCSPVASRWSSSRLVAVLAACGAAAPTATHTATDPRAATKAKATYDEAYAKASAGDIAGSLPLFRRATELDPNLAPAWFDLGGVSEQTGDAPGAITAFEHCVAISPGFIEARAELGTLYHAQRDYAKAVAQFRAALTTTEPYIDPRFSRAYSRGHALHNLAATYVDIGFPGAAQAIAASLLNDPDAEDADLDRMIDRTGELIDKAPAQALAKRLADFEHDVSAATTAAAATPLIERYQPLVKEVDVDGTARIDRWQVLRLAAKLYTTTNQPAAAEPLLVHANDLARALPLLAWLDGTYEVARLHVKLGKLDAALHDLDELVWLESVAKYDRGPAGEQHYSQRMQADQAFTPLRAKLDPLAKQFGVR